MVSGVPIGKLVGQKEAGKGWGRRQGGFQIHVYMHVNRDGNSICRCHKGFADCGLPTLASLQGSRAVDQDHAPQSPIEGRPYSQIAGMLPPIKFKSPLESELPGPPC